MGPMVWQYLFQYYNRTSEKYSTFMNIVNFFRYFHWAKCKNRNKYIIKSKVFIYSVFSSIHTPVCEIIKCLLSEIWKMQTSEQVIHHLSLDIQFTKYTFYMKISFSYTLTGFRMFAIYHVNMFLNTLRDGLGFQLLNSVACKSKSFHEQFFYNSLTLQI